MANPRKRLSDHEMQAISRAVADPRRFAILQQIARQDATPCSSLTEHQVLSPATISHHLKELAEAGLIEAERKGRCSLLTVKRDTWSAYLNQLAKL